ncbi:hypothetical protein SISSUDRAFT_686606 [Sistotremastrum suecicum HHB10207 ss-3]|uniref:DUF1753-domain-containing protein n=1 Tax=Sistotremastrum suecicum HHB10207 ss-3 TaxID=1314776 RepID=A0A166I3E8_9AGAM|nr:hypothetical protein SISSUDRAFT_686606 [Sistotremastrum suecicum HHB10207 ss-3]
MFRRPAPPQGHPPPYAFVTRVYQKSLRPVVLAMGFAAWLWTLLWAISNFQDISGDRSHNLPKFVVFDIVLGALYISVTAMETFGIAAVYLQNLALVRLYVGMSLLAAFIVSGAELLNIVLHFTLKDTLINECTQAATNETISFNFGFFGGHTSEVLTPDEAKQWCNNAWSHDTFSDFAWFLVGTILGLLFASTVYSYYHQLLDPTSVASRLPRATEDVNLNTFPSNSYAPPPGLPPSTSAPPYDPAKLPKYGADAGYTRFDDTKEGQSKFDD